MLLPPSGLFSDGTRQYMYSIYSLLEKGTVRNGMKKKKNNNILSSFQHLLHTDNIFILQRDSSREFLFECAAANNLSSLRGWFFSILSFISEAWRILLTVSRQSIKMDVIQQ